ncbi:hypothetical protein AVEN_99039-1 [Araneus ventricosus]|uniref:Uncharacterized protein n=1 Tax=Araneus ventricosus TaxID=182803 RepID=A0A4Y2RHB5_ARAVE|nr:hypothetical protein AVEN_99039-1 [Araneus ventricosus]
MDWKWWNAKELKTPCADSNLGPRCEGIGKTKDLPTLGPRIETKNETRNPPCGGGGCNCPVAKPGRVGLVVRSWLRGRRFSGSKPISLKIRRVWGLLRVKSYIVAKHPPAGVVRKFGEKDASSGVVLVTGLRFKVTRVRPKTALVLLQNGTLI